MSKILTAGGMRSCGVPILYSADIKDPSYDTDAFPVSIIPDVVKLPENKTELRTLPGLLGSIPTGNGALI